MSKLKGYLWFWRHDAHLVPLSDKYLFIMPPPLFLVSQFVCSCICLSILWLWWYLWHALMHIHQSSVRVHRKTKWNDWVWFLKAEDHIDICQILTTWMLILRWNNYMPFYLDTSYTVVTQHSSLWMKTRRGMLGSLHPNETFVVYYFLSISLHFQCLLILQSLLNLAV